MTDEEVDDLAKLVPITDIERFFLTRRCGNRSVGSQWPSGSSSDRSG